MNELRVKFNGIPELGIPGAEIKLNPPSNSNEGMSISYLDYHKEVENQKRIYEHLSLWKCR